MRFEHGTSRMCSKSATNQLATFGIYFFKFVILDVRKFCFLNTGFSLNCRGTVPF